MLYAPFFLCFSFFHTHRFVETAVQGVLLKNHFNLSV